MTGAHLDPDGSPGEAGGGLAALLPLVATAAQRQVSDIHVEAERRVRLDSK